MKEFGGNRIRDIDFRANSIGKRKQNPFIQNLCTALLKRPHLLLMASPAVIDQARKFAVLVRVQGSDPKGVKMRKHAFHHYHSGRTTLSASGMLLPHTLYDSEVSERLYGLNGSSSTLIVTTSSIFEPFLTLQHRETIPQGRPDLIPGVQIDCMVESEWLQQDCKYLDKEASLWLPTQLLALRDIPSSTNALQSLIDASVGSPWEVGWSLASHTNVAHPFMDTIERKIEHGTKPSFDSHRHLAEEERSNLSPAKKLTARVAILEVSSLPKDIPNIFISTLQNRGTYLLGVGSPFGVLSPMHFFNSITVGSIGNCYPPKSSSKSLLMADMRCLPGMEGCPIFDEHADLIGILIQPLRQNISGAEIQLVIPWEAIATACSNLLHKKPKIPEEGVEIGKRTSKPIGELFIISRNVNSPSPVAVEKAMASICLITIDDGVWASGVLLNHKGLILTNAHLLEPWRFVKTNTTEGNSWKSSQFYPPLLEESVSLQFSRNNPFVLDEHEKQSRRIRVRLNKVDPWIWSDARVVYISKGSLDVALLQLEQVPDLLRPITIDFNCPSLGSKTYVIGHGLFGPKCGLFPSISSGEVANVVKAKIPASYPATQGDLKYFPAMLKTTAAVYPGGSGGAIVNSNGDMIGLVTSNAKHGGGTVIPHLNFSIPCAALKPIFIFSKDMKDNSLLQIMDEPDDNLSAVWALIPPLSPKPPPLPTRFQSQANEDSEGGKGSRFAKFIAQTQRERDFKKPTVEKISASKL